MVYNFLGQMLILKVKISEIYWRRKTQSQFLNCRYHYMLTGFSEVQAEGLTMSLVEIITSSVLNVTDSTVSKIDQVCN